MNREGYLNADRRGRGFGLTVDQRQHMYDAMLTYQKTLEARGALDWGDADNLSREQYDYAANDVRYLLDIKDKLEVMLKREDREQLAQQCFQVIPVMVTLDILQYQNLFDHR